VTINDTYSFNIFSTFWILYKLTRICKYLFKLEAGIYPLVIRKKLYRICEKKLSSFWCWSIKYNIPFTI